MVANQPSDPPALRLARLQATAAGDPTGGQQTSPDQTPVVAKLIQQNQTQPLQPLQAAQPAVPSSDALMGAYQNALASRVASLNQNAGLANQKNNLATYTQTRKAQAGAVQQRLEDALVNTQDTSIPQVVKDKLSEVFGVTGTTPASSQNQALSRLQTDLSDKDLAKAGWTRDQVNKLVGTYYKPGTVVAPTTDPNSIAGMSSYDLFQIPRPPTPTATPSGPGGRTPLAQDFLRGAGIVGGEVNKGLAALRGGLVVPQTPLTPQVDPIKQAQDLASSVAKVGGPAIRSRVDKTKQGLSKMRNYLFGA